MPRVGQRVRVPEKTLVDRFGSDLTVYPWEGRWFECRQCGARANYLARYPRCPHCLGTVFKALPKGMETGSLSRIEVKRGP